MSNRWVAASRLLPLVLVACAGSETTDVPSVTVSDSAGVTVYEVDWLPPLDDPRFAWSMELERAIWTGEPTPGSPPLLYNPQAVLRLADGTLVVLDAGEQRLAVIAPERDSVLTRFGRTGQGPGEVLSTNGLLGSSGEDTFWLMDPGNRRRTHFSLDGAVLREEPAGDGGSGGLAIQRPITEEAFFYRVFRSTQTGPALLSDSVLTFDEALGRVRAVAPMPPRVPSRSMNTSAFPFLAPAGTFAPIASGGVVVARTDRAAFRHYDDHGSLLSVIRIPLEQRPIPLSEKPAIIEEMALEFAPAARATHEDLADAFPVWSQSWPVADSLFALEHTRWAQPAGDPAIPAGRRIWRLFTTTGRYAGTVHLPAGFGFPYRSERGRLIGIRRNELGVATIESYLMIPPEALAR